MPFFVDVKRELKICEGGGKCFFYGVGEIKKHHRLSN
jgi:hypothetical protein